MLRVVLDTNVLVSVLIRSGKPRELWNAVLDEKMRPVTSTEMLSELRDVLSRPKFRRYTRKASSKTLLRTLNRTAIISRIQDHLPQITEDASDNMVLEAAEKGRANYIVSGDSHMLKLKQFKGIRIVTVDEMLKILRGTIK